MGSVREREFRLGMVWSPSHVTPTLVWGVKNARYDVLQAETVMYRYLTKLFPAGVVAVALLVLAGTSVLAPGRAAPPKTSLGKLNCKSGEIARKDGIESWVCSQEDWTKLQSIKPRPRPGSA